MTANRERKAPPHINFYWQTDSEKERFEATCKRLQLGRSEVARRAIRLGLSQLQNVELPGGADDEDGD
jgi:hypothetical protein